MNLKLTIRSEISETCIGASVILRRVTVLKDEKGDLFADSHSILAKCRNHFFHLFNVHGVSEVRQTEIRTAEPLMLEQSAFDVDMAIEKLKGQKPPGIDQIPAELIKTGVE